MRHFPRYFRDHKQQNLFCTLVLASLFDGLLLAGRLYLNRANAVDLFEGGDASLKYRIYPTFLFLAWNLFLAWVPYLAALRLGKLQRRNAAVWNLLLWLVIWLAFLPNAPYIVTDFIHLKYRPPVPFWYDLLLLFAFAFTGLMLGLLSLHEVQRTLRQWFAPLWTWLMALSAIGLSGFGVWLGRFQRWNSWDLVTNPLGLLRDIAHTFMQRHELLQALGISALLSGILLMGYGMLSAMLHEKNQV